MATGGLDLQWEIGRNRRLAGSFDLHGARNENFAAHTGIANAQFRADSLEQEKSS